MKKVLILTGSESDFTRVTDLSKLLDEASVEYDLKTASCHRDLEKLNELIKQLSEDPYIAIIAIANAVSNMPAIVASALKDTKTIVVGVGLDDKGLNGIDSLLSINTIPKGVPLVNTGIGEVGLINAGLFVIKLLK
jgi:5-(carboxyamino)imidazole ribonucleotide mutase